MVSLISGILGLVYTFFLTECIFTHPNQVSISPKLTSLPVNFSEDFGVKKLAVFLE
jgi:hypothetical protein